LGLRLGSARKDDQLAHGKGYHSTAAMLANLRR
jgi:hypothetical protein